MYKSYKFEGMCLLVLLRKFNFNEYLEDIKLYSGGNFNEYTIKQFTIVTENLYIDVIYEWEPSFLTRVYKLN